MQPHFETDAGIIFERRVGNPLIQTACCAIFTDFFQEGGVVDRDSFRGHQHGRGCNDAATGLQVFTNEDIENLFLQVGACGKRQIEMSSVVILNGQCCFLWILDLEAVF